MAKHLGVTIAHDRLVLVRKRDDIAEEAALDGL